MEEKIIAFIKKDLLHDPDIIITPETKLISGGVIDSFSLVSLHVYLQKEFGKRIPASKVTASSFDTVKQIVEIANQF
jgi:acyl carrier protein